MSSVIIICTSFILVNVHRSNTVKSQLSEALGLYNFVMVFWLSSKKKMGANFCNELLLRSCGVLIYRRGTTGMFCYQTDEPITGGPYKGCGGGGLTISILR